jgi:hypothetical protein
MRVLMKRLAMGCLLAAAVYAAETPADVRDAVQRLEQKAANAPAGLGIEFRVRAAQALSASWPELANELVSRCVARLRSGAGWRLTPDVMRALAIMDPDGAISVLPRMQVSYAGAVIDGLGRLHRIEDARSVYRAALARGLLVIAPFSLFIQLCNEKSPQAGDLYLDMLSGFSFDALAPDDALWIDSALTRSIVEIAPAAAVEGTVRILMAASNPAYAKDTAADATGDFVVGSQPVTTNNSQDTILLVAGARLFSLAPAEFEKRRALFARWGAAAPIVIKSIRAAHSTRAKTVFSTGRIPKPVSVVVSRVEELEEQAGVDDKAVVDLSAELRRLPPGWGKLEGSRRLCEIALRRQAGRPALTAAASALQVAIGDSHPVLDPGQVATSFSEDYLRVAELIRYAGVRLSATSPTIEAADALLSLRERVLEHTGFAVEDLNGKPRTISPVPGKVTMVSLVTNVCARWKAQCDRPLPELQAFYQKVEDKGVAVFAIAEEGRMLFTESLEGATFTVPLFLHPDDAFADLYAVPDRHETFLFDREGKLVSRAIGIRTREQLSQMVKQAGVQ